MAQCGAQRVVGFHQFVNGNSPPITGVTARTAPGGFFELRRRRIDTEFLHRSQYRFRNDGQAGNGSGAMIAETPYQTLGDNSSDRCAHQKGLDPHIGQPQKCRGRIVGVQRGKYPMSRQRRLYGDTRCIDVSNFTDHDRIRIVSQDGTQSSGECKTDVRMHLKLSHPWNLLFYRVLHSQYPFVSRVTRNECGIERCALSRSGWPGDQHDTVRLCHPVPIHHQMIWFNPDIVQIEARVLCIRQQTQDQ